MQKNKPGVSLIEILIVVAIIALLLIVFLVGLFDQLPKSRDARRKSDLEKIKVAFEDYYNDNDCYPPQTVLESCGSQDLDPYLREIPCDPFDSQPYEYITGTNVCAGYRVLVRLENENDPIIDELDCSGGCGSGLSSDYNYGISSGMALSDGNVINATPAPGTPSPTPSGPIYVYACDRNGVCNQYAEGHPFLVNCPITWPTPEQCEAADCVANASLRCN